MSVLSRVDLFSGLDDATLRQLDRALVRQSFAKNTVVLVEGEPGDALFVIVSGRVKVFVGNSVGREVTLANLLPGDYFGELSLLDGSPRSASVRATENSELAMLDRELFGRFLQQHPHACRLLLRRLSQRIRQLTQLVRDIALRDVYSRVSRMLREIAAPNGEHHIISQKLTHQDIANRVGASREMVSRIMKELTAGGYIRREGRAIWVSNRLPPAW